MLVRAACDPSAHVFISHPFSIVTAAFCAVSTHVSFFDDGIAYYTDSPLPDGPRERLDRLLTRRFVAWKSLTGPNTGTYADLLRHSRLESFFAMYPDLIDAAETPVMPIDLEAAFGRIDAENTGSVHPRAGISLFLDTREDRNSAIDCAGVLTELEAIARCSPDGKLYFKPHPSQVSRVSLALRSRPWAIETDRHIERFDPAAPVSHVVSFHSSGAIVLALLYPQTRLTNIMSSQSTPEPGLERLFSQFDTTIVLVDEPATAPRRPHSNHGGDTRHAENQ